MRLLPAIAILMTTLCHQAAANDSLFAPKPKASEFVLYFPDYIKEFNERAKAPNKCSQENYRRMEAIINEVYVWENFQKDLGRLELINSINGVIFINDHNEVVNQVPPQVEDIAKEDEEKAKGPAGFDLKQAIEALNAWWVRNCTVLGKTKELYLELKEKVQRP